MENPELTSYVVNRNKLWDTHSSTTCSHLQVIWPRNRTKITLYDWGREASRISKTKAQATLRRKLLRRHDKAGMAFIEWRSRVGQVPWCLTTMRSPITTTPLYIVCDTKYSITIFNHTWYCHNSSLVMFVIGIAHGCIVRGCRCVNT